MLHWIYLKSTVKQQEEFSNFEFIQRNVQDMNLLFFGVTLNMYFPVP